MRSSRASTTAAIILLATVACAAQSKPASPVRSADGGADASHLPAGFIYGQGWAIGFQHMLDGWADDSALANSLGLQQVFHPKHWNSAALSPAIFVAFSDSQGGKITVADEVERDAEATVKENSSTTIAAAPNLALPGGRVAAVRVFSNDRGWSTVVYSDGGAAIFLTTLRCSKAKQCAKFVPRFRQFAQSLVFFSDMKSAAH